MTSKTTLNSLLFIKKLQNKTNSYLLEKSEFLSQDFVLFQHDKPAQHFQV